MVDQTLQNCNAIATFRLYLSAISITIDRFMHNSISQDEIAELIPRRALRTSKFDYGRVAVIGGTRSMRGAPSLTAHAALALGAGIVDLITPSTHPLTPREIIAHEMPAHDDGTIHADAAPQIQDLLCRATVVALGPGLGSNTATIAMISRCIAELTPEIPVIIDADGLRCLPIEGSRREYVITPHIGEFSRLLGVARQDLEHCYAERAQSYAQEHRMVVHVKHVPSVTTDGSTITYLHGGTPAMSTAGAGDVLTGIIAALVAQHVRPLHAARIGAWLHARAGENLVQVTGHRSLMAHELIESARQVLGQISYQARPHQPS